MWCKGLQQYVKKYAPRRPTSVEAKEQDELPSLKIDDNLGLAIHIIDTYNNKTQNRFVMHVGQRVVQQQHHIQPTTLMCSSIIEFNRIWDPMIEFIAQNLRHVSIPHSDPLVVTLQIRSYQVQRILVDTRSSTSFSMVVPN